MEGNVPVGRERLTIERMVGDILLFSIFENSSWDRMRWDCDHNMS